MKKPLAASMRVTIRSQAGVVRAVEALIQVPLELPITEARLLRAYRAILVEGISILRSALGWTEIVLERRELAPPPPKDGRVVGTSTGFWGADSLSVVTPSQDVEYVARAIGIVPSHPLATTFAGHVFHALHAAMDGAAALDGARTGSETTDVAYELLSGGLREAVLASFMRGLLEEPLPPGATFMIGYRPFTAPFVASAAVLRWLGSLASRTYEGAPVRTGLVVEAKPGVLNRSPGVVVVPLKPDLKFMDLSGQHLALADGERSFLVVRPTLRVTGVAWLEHGLERHVGGTLADAPSPPLSALWVQSRRAEMLRLFGSTQASTFQLGQVRQGVFQLHSRRMAEESLAAILMSAVRPGHDADVQMLARQLLLRAEEGHGAGALVGTGRAQGGSRLVRPVAVSDGAWLPFLNPDGAVVLDRSLRLVEYRVNLPQPKRRLLADRGTRHNALAWASRRSKCVAIAVSDDGSLMAFKVGVPVLVVP